LFGFRLISLDKLLYHVCLDYLARWIKECSCYPQTATLYASLPNLKRFWTWLYPKEEEEKSTLATLDRMVK